MVPTPHAPGARALAGLLGSLLCLVASPADADGFVIVGADVADGSGAPLKRANVRVREDKIVAVGSFRPEKGERVLLARGLVLAPGFIDIHNHSAEGLAEEPLAVSQISQGITTLVLGADGSSPWSVADYLRERRQSAAALNVALLVGHATVRKLVLGEDYRRAATAEETARMASLVEQGMREGAVGLSSGLEYEVGSYAATEELVELSRAAGRHGGFYMTHIRDEADKSLEAFAEAAAIGERAGVAVQISHIKLGTVGVWGKTAEVRSMIEGARRRGLDVTADAYPYTAWHANIEVLVPNKRYDDPASVEEALADVGGAAKITIARCEKHPDYEKRTLEEIAVSEGITPVELFIRIMRDGGANVIGHSMTEPDVEFFFRQPWVMVASDGGIGSSHPRGAGTFPRVLGRYARERKVFPLPEAIRKMTSLPASRLKLPDRGRIVEGAKADLVLFDPAAVTDRSTFADPDLLSDGIRTVVVNGETVWENGRATGARPGRLLGLGGDSLLSRVDEVFRHLDRRDSPGCAMGVIRDGRLLDSRGYGMASLEHGVPITPETVFDIGSAAKQFAAASVVLLAQQGRLSLNDDVRQYVWELPDFGRRITIRHLLQHTSGLPDYIGLLYLAGRRTEDLSTEEEALSALSRVRKLEFEPGTAHRYSNSGYFLLSVIVRRASGQSLREFARQNIFEPLGMRSTDYLDDHRRIVPRRATGYTEKRDGGFEVEASDWEQTGDGGLQTSVPDLALWVRNFSEPLVGGRAMTQELTTPGRLGNGQAISYAAGLRVDEYRGARRIGHAGSWAGFRAVVTLLPEHRFAAITLCNLSSAQPSELARKVVDVYLEKELRPEKTAGHSKTEDPGKPARLSPGELARYAGLYWNRQEDSVHRVVLRNGTLFYERGPQDESELEPLGASRFRLQGTTSCIEVVFSASAPGGAGQMRVSVDRGEPDLFERRTPANPSPAELTAYAGHYTSEELAARFEIVWAGDRLRLRRSGYPEADLEPLFRDSFREEEMGLLLFGRDAWGRVCGFTVRAGDSTFLFAREPASLGDPELPLR